VTVRVWPSASPGGAARVELSPPGSNIEVNSMVTTGPAGSPGRVDMVRPLGSGGLELRGSVPAGAPAPVNRVTTVANPSMFFVEGFRLALAARGIAVRGGAHRLRDLTNAPPASRIVLATRRSQPLSSLAGYFLKVSQNFYAEMLIKTLGRTASQPGSIAGGRRVISDTLSAWGIPSDAYVIHDGSGLSRYDYTCADTVVSILERVWRDERLRGPFVAALPVAGHDGTLDTRMRGTALDGRVEAKTGSIANVRALSGFLETAAHGHVAFSIIVNNFTAPAARIDAVVERALLRVSAQAP
jgi:D-alanyl-D-alanine carboxypeptidase/D-alanyl-D-alanine-endopeptidase (penicillin-binding protein 4)